MKLNVIMIFISSMVVFSQDDIIHIKTTQDFLNIANNPLGNYVLDNDLDFRHKMIKPIGWDKLDKMKYAFEQPYDAGFRGKFDGGNYTIKNFKIEIHNFEHNSYSGLFSIIYGTVKNLKLRECAVVAENDYVGGLTGVAYDSTIENVESDCQVGGTTKLTGGLIGVNYGTISNSNSSGDVDGIGRVVGGLVGENFGTIINSYATGTASSSSEAVGGLIGRNQGSVSKTFASGYVSGYSNIGGLVGENIGTIDKSYAIGDIAGSENVGGLVGNNNKGIIKESYSSVKNIKGERYVGSAIGRSSEYSIIENIYSQMIEGLMFDQCDKYGINNACLAKIPQTEINTITKIQLPGGFSSNEWVFFVNTYYPILRSIDIQIQQQKQDEKEKLIKIFQIDS